MNTRPYSACLRRARSTRSSALALCLLVAACSSDAPPEQATSTAETTPETSAPAPEAQMPALDPCTLLTADDYAAVMGSTPASSLTDTTGIFDFCHYSAAGNAENAYAGVTRQPQADFQQQLDLAKQLVGEEPKRCPFQAAQCTGCRNRTSSSATRTASPFEWRPARRSIRGRRASRSRSASSSTSNERGVRVAVRAIAAQRSTCATPPAGIVRSQRHPVTRRWHGRGRRCYGVAMCGDSRPLRNRPPDARRRE